MLTPLWEGEESFAMRRQAISCCWVFICPQEDGSWRWTTFPPIFAFVLGVFLAEAIKRNQSPLHYLDWKRIILLIETVVLFVIGFIPLSAPNMIVTATVSLVASIQVSSFRKLVDSQFNTTMSTGNLRSASQALYLAVTQKDEDAAIRSIRYFAVIFSFFSGALAGGIITSLVGIKAIWSTIVLLIYAAVLIDMEEHRVKKIQSD